MTPKQDNNKTAYFTSNTLYYYANKYRIHPTDEEETERIDMTQTFWNTLDKMVKNGEIIIIQVNGKMREGKSTVGLLIAHHIYQLLIKYKKRPDTPFSVKHNIAMDQSEFDTKMRNPETTFTVIATDEYNQAEDTGQDVTIIKALQDDQSNIQADRYVHRVNMSPTGMTDTNTDIILRCCAIDREKMQTMCKLYYRLTENNIDYPQLLGHVTFDVSPIISNWTNNVKETFYDKLRLEALLENKKLTEPERKKILTKLNTLNAFIDKHAAHDWYVEYYMKKRRKIELVTKHKIIRPRLLPYAQPILSVINLYKPCTQYGEILKRDTVKSGVRIAMKQANLPQSMLGEDLTTQEALGVLEAYKAYWRIEKRIEKLQMKNSDSDLAKREIHDLETAKQNILTGIQLNIEEYQRMIDVKNIYEKEHGE